MKKGNILGFLIGVLSLSILIWLRPIETTHAELGAWDKLVASADSLDWNDVFSGGNDGKDLYALVNLKMLYKPKEDAAKEVAKSYGLTVDEVNRVKGGSKTPIFNNPNKNSGQLTQEQALLIMENIIDDYNHFEELYTLQQELDLAAKPSEMFSNGDLSDSGFDLVHDLEIMEEILFVDVVKNTLGQPYQNQLSNPFLPTDDDQSLKDYVGSENDAATINLFSGGNTKFGSSVKDGSLKPGNVKIKVGETTVDVNVLLNDICPTPLKKPLSNALKDYVANNGDSEFKDTGGAGSGGGAGGFGAGGGDNKSGSSSGELKPAEPADWLKTWCPILEGNTTEPNVKFSGSGKFNSLGNASTAVLEQSAKTINKKPALKVHFSLCLEVEYVKQTLTSYIPNQNDSCVLCEIQKINKIMDKTLSHSLIPNKVTGNYLESAKCKSAYEPLVDMKFVTIKAPVPAPPNDDLIFGRNVFDEWNKFITRYQPLLLPKAETYIKSATNNAPADTTQLDILNELERSLAADKAKALSDLAVKQLSSDGLDKKLYAQVVLKELDGLASFFESYFKLFEDTAKVCNEIGKKPNIE